MRKGGYSLQRQENASGCLENPSTNRRTHLRSEESDLVLHKTSEDCPHSGNIVVKQGRTTAWCNICETGVGHFLPPTTMTFREIVEGVSFSDIKDQFGEAEVKLDLRTGIQTMDKVSA